MRRIADITGVRLTDLRSDPFLRLSNDTLLLVDVLWLLCEKQAKENGITDIQFGEALGDQIDSATEAMQEAIVNFSPSARRSLLRSLIAENSTIQMEAMEMAVADLQADRTKLTEAMARRAKAEIRRHLEAIDSVDLPADKSAT